ncbi:hypothetical protein ACROYT_G015322 [Oculina patagonica]
MISFYNRQATTGIRAEPKDVIACMQAQGVEVLKESQITNWWSSYHQKKKRLLTAEADHLRILLFIKADFYIDSIFHDTLLPFVNQMFSDGYRSQQDNDPKHTNHGIGYMPISAESPDLNPAEIMCQAEPLEDRHQAMK